MGWFKVAEHNTRSNRINHRNRDRKGGHSPSALIGDDGIVWITPAQRRAEKKHKNKKMRAEFRKEDCRLIAEMIVANAEDALEKALLEEEDELWWQENGELMLKLEEEVDDYDFERQEDYLDYYDPWGHDIWLDDDTW